ncbi:unnamed protein product [Echinostoma caproni]|uniref:Thioredoxin domain-containing protein n=1 Tax=Echinostoma caproni TaxID=27848 RepID=A0A183ABQ6_9TREM|nr:unnamed protein product [Echinostoma caproni]
MSRQIRSKEDLENTIKIAAHRLVIIQFTAKWCGASQMISSAWESMRKEFPVYTFVRVDVDATPDAAQAYGVTSTPAFVFMKDSLKLDSFCGANESRLRDTILRHRRPSLCVSR